MVIAIVRVRGISGIKPDIKKTMELLKLTRKHHCVLYKDVTPSLKGMLRVCKDYCTWGSVSGETLRSLIEKRGRFSGDKHVPSNQVEKIAKAIEVGEKIEIKPVFRLSPPSKGWEPMKDRYPKGALGPRDEEMNLLLKRMI